MMGAAAFRSETDTTLWTVRRRLDIAAQPAQPAAHACCSDVCVLVRATPTHETESERVCVRHHSGVTAHTPVRFRLALGVAAEFRGSKS